MIRTLAIIVAYAFAVTLQALLILVAFSYYWPPGFLDFGAPILFLSCIAGVLFLLAVEIAGASLIARSRLAHSGNCARCAYNLTGNVTGRCPECGAPIPAAQQSRIQNSKSKITSAAPDRGR